MDDKKFSMIILIFVFIVAIPSTIFLFSDAMSTGEVVIGGLPKDITNYGHDPAPYSYQKRGVEVPIYNEQGVVVRYERRAPTPTAEYLDRPAYEGTYSAMKMGGGCPAGCIRIKREEAQTFKNQGYIVQYMGDSVGGFACKCAKSSI